MRSLLPRILGSLAAIALGVGLSACTNAADDAFAGSEAAATRATAPNLTFAFKSHQFQSVGELPSRTIAGVPVQVLTERALDLDPESRDSMRVRASFGRLDRSTYDSLARHFGPSRAVAYDPNRTYFVEDFLGPLVRFLDGQTFDASTSVHPLLQSWVARYPDEVDPSSAEVTLSTNCWQTALELLRNDSVFQIYYPPEEAAARTFADHTLFAPVSADSIRTGDVLFIFAEDPRSGETVARHAAYHVGGDLYFEKTGGSPRHLFRFVTGEEILRDYPTDVYTHVVERHTGKPLPAPDSFTVSRLDPDLARELPQEIAEKFSVEAAFGQGVSSYTFVGLATAPYPR